MRKLSYTAVCLLFNPGKITSYRDRLGSEVALGTFYTGENIYHPFILVIEDYPLKK